YMAGAQADIPIAADTVAAKWVPKSGLALVDGLPAAEALRNEQGISPVQLVPEYPGLYAFEQQNEAGEKLKFWLAVTADPYEADWSNDQGPVVSQTSPHADTAAGERAGTSEHSETASAAGSLMPWRAALALAVSAAEGGVDQRGRSI
ncbi:VWA domain-containing protein, partial [Clostridium perfringens]